MTQNLRPKTYVPKPNTQDLTPKTQTPNTLKQYALQGNDKIHQK